MSLHVLISLQYEKKNRNQTQSEIAPYRRTLLSNGVKISPITGPSCPEGSSKLRFPDYVTTAQDGGKVVSLKHRQLFTPRKYS